MVKRCIAGLVVLVPVLALVSVPEPGFLRSQTSPGNSQCCQVGLGTDCQGCYNAVMFYLQLGINTYNVCTGSPDSSDVCNSQKSACFTGFNMVEYSDINCTIPNGNVDTKVVIDRTQCSTGSSVCD